MAQHVGASSPMRVELKKNGIAHMPGIKFRFFGGTSGLVHRNPQYPTSLKERGAFCDKTGVRGAGAKCFQFKEDHSDFSRRGDDESKAGEKLYKCMLTGDDRDIPKTHKNYSGQGLADACRFVHNDAKFVNERARNDMILLSRGISRLNNRARQDVAILGVGFLKLDARAREDTEKIDHGVKRRAERLHHLAMNLKDKAGSKLKRVADQHWSDGALEADLRRADLLVKTRALRDAYTALEFVKNIHDMMVSKVNNIPMERSSSSVGDVLESIMLEKNGETFNFLPGEISADRINALQEIYWSMASALSEADGIDYTNPEELEWSVRTLIDLDAMDGKNSASLLAECSSSPDVGTRQALANALAAAPSMSTLGNAGMGALQRLAEDSNPAVAVAASKAIDEVRRQWEVEDGDNFRFTMNVLKADETQDGSENLEQKDTP